MTKESKKRNRGVNFSNQEKEVLLNLVTSFKDILENRKTDMVTNKKKERAWEDIKDLFNTRPPNCVFRTAESLKKCYDNMKKKARHVANERLESIKTGGTPVSHDTRTCENLAFSLMHPKIVTKLENMFGDNIARFSVNEDTSAHRTENSQPVDINEKVNDSSDNCQDNSNVDWSDCSAANLKTPISKRLKLKRNSETQWSARRIPATPVTDKVTYEQCNELTKLKIELAQLQKVAFEENNKHIQDIFELMKVNLKLDAALKEAQLKKLCD